MLAQSHPDFELIIVNDGSTDQGPEIVRAIQDSRITVIDQRNAGVSAARNRGIEVAQGELIAFLDADDEWRSEYLPTIVRLRDRYPGAGIYATAYQILDKQNWMVNPKFKSIPPAPWEGIIARYFRSAALGFPPVCSSACCVPRQVLRTVGGFAPKRRMGEDLDLWARIALKYPVAFSTYQGAVYCQNAENRACTTFGRQDEHPFIETAERLRQTGGIPAHLAADVDCYITRLKIENIRQYVLAGDFERARELSRALKKTWHFPLWQLMWVSSLNGISRRVWHFRHMRPSRE